MSELFNPETGWLNATNAILGIAVLICLFAVGRVVLAELRALAVKRARASLATDDHTFDLATLGITMADGGEPINEMAIKPKRPSGESDEPQNIIRSDN